MLIACSTFSCALACAGDQSRETLRSSQILYLYLLHGEGGWSPPDSEDMSPNVSELDSASLHYLLAVILPKVMKPATSEEATSMSTHWAIRGAWRERVSKDWQQVPGEPPRCTVGEVELHLSAVQGVRGINNSGFCRRRKSERPIVAEKRGNARGAKGLYVSRASIETVRSA
jgi:hypothetical protein